MNYALYLDPAKKYNASDLPDDAAGMMYWRLTDCMADAFDASLLPPQAHHAPLVIVEINARQYALFGLIASYVHCVCINYHAKSDIDLGSLVQSHIVDMTYHGRKGDSVETLKPLLQRWIDAGVHQISLYDVSDYHIWLELVTFLQQNGYIFFDRFHAARDGFASPYQKHVAQYSDVYALGGWSRVTDVSSTTRVKSPVRKTWQMLSTDDARWERLVLGMAHRDGMPMADIVALCGHDAVQRICKSGLATSDDKGRLVPTMGGLWDNLGLVAILLGE